MTLPHVSGPLADWLESERDVLNEKFRAARWRTPTLDPELTLRLVAELLPPFAGSGRALLDALYDLVLLHAGRGKLTPDSPLDRLLRETFVAAPPLLAQAPDTLAAELSNATEKLESRGRAERFVRGLGAVTPLVSSPAALRDAGAVIAWRLGEARLRSAALGAASRIPPRATLVALGLEAWPETGATLVIEALRTDAWRPIGALFKDETLAGLSRAEANETQRVMRLVSAKPKRLGDWGVAAAIGDFYGFGGHFEEPPLLLSNGDQERHRFWALSTGGAYRIDADQFGAVCRRDDAAIDYPVCSRDQKVAGLTLGRDGRIKGERGWPKLSPAAGATSFVPGPAVFAFTRPDSFRIRVLAPAWEPV